jgi:hypothetical protein
MIFQLLFFRRFPPYDEARFPVQDFLKQVADLRCIGCLY